MLDAVAGRAGDVGDDGHLLLSKRIEQARLADIGTAHDGHGHAFTQHLPLTSVLQNGADARFGLNKARADLFRTDDVDVLFWEVERGLDEGAKLRDVAVDVADGIGELAAQRASRRLNGGFAHGINQIGHSLRLSQVHSAVHECAAGEFAGLGHAKPEITALLKAGAHDEAQKHGTAVRLNFEDGLARVAVGSGKEQHDCAVKHPAVRSEKGQEMGVARLQGAVLPEQAPDDLGFERLAEGQAQNADAAAARGRRNGDDGIFVAVVHKALSEGCRRQDRQIVEIVMPAPISLVYDGWVCVFRSL